MSTRPPVWFVAFNALRVIALRIREFGFHSGWICLSVFLINGWLRLRNRFSRAARVTCPCCGWQGYAFRTFDLGRLRLPNMECPQCRSHDRHRMLHVVLSERQLFEATNATVVHFAAEIQVTRFLSTMINPRILAIDINPHHLNNAIGHKVVTDIMQLPLPDNSVDRVVCLHVLEHVLDDRAGLAELHRTLRPGGLAIVMVPLDPTIAATEEWGGPCAEMFDHVRNYSPHDVQDRLAAFQVTAIRPCDLPDPGLQERYAIRDSEIVYLCRKAPLAGRSPA